MAEKRIGRTVLKAGAAVVLGLALAVLSALFFTSPWWIEYPIRDGAWRASARMGNAGDSMYLRAYTARIAWFSNDPDANVYYEARVDSAGQTLDPHCSYELAGGPLPARWWSVTAYAGAHWIANPQNRYSYTSTNIAYEAGQQWAIEAGPRPKAGNWLPTAGAKGRLTFILRLYDLRPGMSAMAATLPVPRIERRDCS